MATDKKPELSEEDAEVLRRHRVVVKGLRKLSRKQRHRLTREVAKRIEKG